MNGSVITWAQVAGIIAIVGVVVASTNSIKDVDAKVVKNAGQISENVERIAFGRERITRANGQIQMLMQSQAVTDQVNADVREDLREFREELKKIDEKLDLILQGRL